MKHIMKINEFFSLNELNYVVLGSNGFAQTTDDDYDKKSQFELNYLLSLLSEKYPIPENLPIKYEIKNFPYDNTSYNEIVISYPEELDDDDDDMWDFIDDVESFDLEDDEISDYLKENYNK